MRKRGALVLPWVVALVVFGRGSDATAVEQDLPGRLTANVWTEECRSYNGWPLSCNTIELRENGSYSWITRSDVAERGDTGRWSFEPTQDGALLFLSESGVIHVRFENSDLVFGPLDRLHAGATLGSAARTSPPAVAPPELYRELTNGPWFKANDFDLYYLPDSAEFRPDGTALLTYRGGECRLVADWSVYRTGPPRRVWELHYRGLGSCDLRDLQRPSSSFKSRLDLTEGILRMRDLYTRNPSATKQQRIFLDDGRMRLTGKLSGQLVAGHTVRADLALESLDSYSCAAKRLKVWIEPLEFADGKFKLAGPSQVLSSLALPQRTGAPESNISVSISLTPREPAEWATLFFEVEGERKTAFRVMTTIHSATP
jgi:hypothetical protein